MKIGICRTNLNNGKGPTYFYFIRLKSGVVLTPDNTESYKDREQCEKALKSALAELKGK